MGKPVFSSGDTNASMEPSREIAMWLTLISSGTGMANCMSVVGAGRHATYHVIAATAASANAMEDQSSSGNRRDVATAARAILLASVPESALRAKDKSRAD